MANPGKQIEGVTGETLVKDLAQAAVEQRLTAVVSSFPLAAKAPVDEPEPVHQLRVGTRRAVAALELFEKFCPPRRAKRLLKQLKKIRRAAGAARDLDVFTTRLSSSSDDAHQVLLHDLVAGRQVAQEEIAKLYQRLTTSDRLSKEVGAVTKKLRPRGKKANRQGQQLLSQWAPRKLRKASGRLLAAVPKTLHEVEELHVLRIEGKRLRYTLELLAAGLPEETYQELYPLLEEMQDRLGAINDHQGAIERLGTYSTADREVIGRAVETERAGMEQAIADVRGWFPDDFLPRLETAIGGKRDGSPKGDPEAASD